MEQHEAGNDFTDSPRIADVLRWLKGQGWQVGQSRIYQDAQAGKLARNKAGNFTTTLVNRYARTWLKRADTGQTTSQAAAELAEKKLRAEIELKQTQAERERYLLQKERAQYIHRDQTEAEIIGRAVVIDAALDHAFSQCAPEIVELIKQADGKSACIPAVIESLMRMKDEVFEYLAAPRCYDIGAIPAPPEEE